MNDVNDLPVKSQQLDTPNLGLQLLLASELRTGRWQARSPPCSEADSSRSISNEDQPRKEPKTMALPRPSSTIR